MKIILLLTALSGLAAAQAIPFPGPGGRSLTSGGAISVVSSGALQNGAFDVPLLTVYSSMTAGNKAIIIIGNFYITIPAPTVKLSDGTTSCTVNASGGGQGPGGYGDHSVWIALCPAIPSGITGYTVTFPTHADLPCSSVIEVSGLKGTLDATTVTAIAGTAAWVTPAISPVSGQNEIIVGAVYNFNGGPLTATFGSLGTQINSTTSCVVQYSVQSSTSGTYSFTGMATSTTTATTGASFK